jgi:uncharacterized damage-inducible protein DinB
MTTPIANEIIEQCIMRMEENPPRIQKCLDQLTEAEVWLRPNANTVSIANLILHLCGNIRQYAISSLGNVPDTRQRDIEFSTNGGYSKTELMEMLYTTVAQATKTIRQTNDEELLRVRTVQGFNLSGIGIMIHITEHLSYHTGQIALHTKLLKQKDLGFYAGINLGITNNTE